MPVRAIQFALNHMTAPRLDAPGLLSLAAELGCSGVEYRIDLAGRELFDGQDGAAIGAIALSAGLRILALAEIKAFNAWTRETAERAAILIDIAAWCGAEAVSLIPTNDGTGCGNGERRVNLRLALRELGPLLEARGLIGLIEPLGFETCSLRYKEEAVNAIAALGAEGRFRIIHDTFHHFIAGETAFYPQNTGMVHVSGVVDPVVSASEMRDGHRVLISPEDRLGNVGQVAALVAAGYVGPISIEAFSPEVHALASPREALAKSLDFLRLGVIRAAA